MLGGMRIPIVPPAATHPVASRVSYLYSFISGKAMDPIVAAVAVEEPEIAAKPPHPTTVAIARPPGKCPIHL